MKSELINRLHQLEKNAPIKKLKLENEVAFIENENNLWTTKRRNKTISNKKLNAVITSLENENKIYCPKIIFIDDIPNDD